MENQKKNNFFVVRTGFEPVQSFRSCSLDKAYSTVSKEVGISYFQPTHIGVILACVYQFRHLTVLEMVCGVDPLPLQPKGFTQKGLLELSSVSYLPELLTTSFDVYPRRDGRI